MIDAAYWTKKESAIVWCAVIAPNGYTACGLAHSRWSDERVELCESDDPCPNCEQVLATTTTLREPTARTLIAKPCGFGVDGGECYSCELERLRTHVGDRHG